MKVIGSKYPINIELLKTEKNISTVALRKNVVEKYEYDKLTGKPQAQYEYEQVNIIIKNKPNLIQYIESNFDNWFQNGLKLEQLEKEIKEKELEMKTLINNYGQIDVNSNIKEDIITSYDALTSLYANNAILTKNNDILKEENLLLMEAIAELYTMLMA